MKSLKKVQYQHIYLGVIAIGVLTLIFALGVTNGEAWKSVLFFDESNSDRFMDFFNCVYEATNLRVYQDYGSIYPPIANLFYYVINILLPDSLLMNGASALRNSPEGMLIHTIYAIITVLCLFVVVHYLSVQAGKKSVVSLFIVACSLPLLFALERGNLILWAVIFAMLFWLWKDSTSKVKRELALVCLAFAFNIKIYPAILGLFLLKEKRWKEAIRCAIYAIVLFFVPFIFFGGLGAFKILLESLTSTTESFQVRGYGFKVNFSNTFLTIASLLGYSGAFLAKTAQYLNCFFCGLLAVSFFVVKEKWKQVAALCLIIVCFPSFSYTYNLCYLFLPLILFLRESKYDKESGAEKWIYTLAWSAIMVMVPFSFRALEFLPGYWKPQLANIVEGVFLYGMTICIVVDAMRVLCKTKRLQRFAKISIIVLPSIVLAIILGRMVYNQAHFAAQYETYYLKPIKSILEEQELKAEDVLLLTPYNAMLYKSLTTEHQANLLPSKYYMIETIPTTLQTRSLVESLFLALQERSSLVITKEFFEEWVKQSNLFENGILSLFSITKDQDGYLLLTPDGESKGMGNELSEVQGIITYEGDLYQKNSGALEKITSSYKLIDVVEEAKKLESLAIEKGWLQHNIGIASYQEQYLQDLLRYLDFSEETENYYIFRKHKNSSTGNALFFIKRHSGLYEDEGGYAWSRQDFTVELINVSSEPQEIELMFQAQSPQQSKEFAAVLSFLGQEITCNSRNGVMRETITLNLPTGSTILTLSTNLNRVQNTQDSRSLYFTINKFTIQSTSFEGIVENQVLS